MSLTLEREVAGSSFVDCFSRILGDGHCEGSEWVFHCPFPGCVGYEKPKFYVNPNNGCWACHHCNYAVPDKVYREDSRAQHGGTWREFVRLMGDDPDLWPKNQTTVDPATYKLDLPAAQVIWTEFISRLRLLPQHRDLMAARGVDAVAAGYVSSDYRIWKEFITAMDPEFAVKTGLAWLNTELGELCPTLCCRPGRMLIPYREGDLVRYFVGYQKQPPTYHKDSWKKIANITRYAPPLYGSLPVKARFGLITEGQIKRDAAFQRGFPIISRPGIAQLHKEVRAHFRKQKVPVAILVDDTQRDNMDVVDTAAANLARELLKSKIIVYRATLPLEPEVDQGAKMDIDAYLARHSVEEFLEVLGNAQRCLFDTEVEALSAADPLEGEEEPEGEGDPADV